MLVRYFVYVCVCIGDQEREGVCRRS